jgi:deoxyribonuclease-4
MLRVRQLIPYLDNLTTLKKEKVLPNQALFTKIPRGGKFPKLAKKMGYREFGLFMEKIIQEAIICSEDNLIELYENLNVHLTEDLQKYFHPEEFIKIGELAREHFPEVPIFEPEWILDNSNIAGHPDVVCEDCVYDIKTTGRFNAMRKETIYQLLSYFCLAQLQDMSISSIGLILPAQLRVITYDLSSWNWKPFWQKLNQCINIKRERESLYDISPSDFFLFKQLLVKVGHHIEKEHLPSALDRGLPLQFFVGGRVSTRVNKLTNSLTKKLKERTHPALFIHAPYNINLSKPFGTQKRESDESLPDDLPWTCYQVREILDTGVKAGINGVVVHCGKRGGITEKEALKGMYESLCKISPFIEVDKCPLLLETSSGQSGETLCDPEEFSDFYYSLPEVTRDKIKVCVDTCHVFAAGHDPMDFIRHLESKAIPIALIHYNDSKMPKGSKRDRHAPIGRGCIGASPLLQVLLWATSNEIPCVIE